MTAQLEKPLGDPVVAAAITDDEPATPTPRGSVARNIGSMLFGRAFVAGASWIGSIAIARALGSTEWGQYSFVFALLGVMSVITDLGVGRVVLARLVADGEDEARLVASSFVALRLGLGLVGYAAAVLFVVVAGYPGEVIVATAVAGLVVVVATPSHALTVLFQSRLKLTVIAIIESLSQVVQLAATVIAVLVAPVLLFVVIPAVLFEIVSLIGKMWFVGVGRLGYRPTKRVEIWRWSEMMREALPLSIGFALTVLLTKIDMPILSKLGSFDAVGHYAIAYKFSDLVSMIGIAITTPITAVLVAAWPTRIAEFRSRTQGAAILTTLLAGMAVIGIWPSAAPLVRTLYGASYADADHATRLLVLSAGLSSFTLLGVMALVSAGRNRIFPIIAGFGLALNVALNVLLIPRMSFNGSAVATIVTEVIVGVLIWGAVLYELRVGALIPWSRMAGLVVLIAVLTVVATWIAPSDSLVGVVVGAVGAVALLFLAKAFRLIPSIDPRKLLAAPMFDEDDDTESLADAPVDDSTVVQTYFGPPDTPLFGAIHVPASGTARAGVVLCPPLGKEQIDTTRGVRMLAEDLAAHGIVAMRMDYLHTGESWGEQESPDAVDNWIASVEHAVTHLREMGITHIELVGLRAGALIATAAAHRVDGVAGLVLWDPVLRGRSWVRGQQQLFRMAVAADSGGVAHNDPNATDAVEVVGATWHRNTSVALSATSITAESLPDCPILLAVADSDVDSAPIRALAGAETLTGRLDMRTIGDTTGFVTPPSFYVELPHTGVAVIADWIHTHTPTEAGPVAVTATTSAVVYTAEAATVTTEFVTSPEGALIWITRPRDAAAHSALVVHSTANDVRTGPARLWQVTATHAAARGAVTLRYDRGGVGESGRVNRRDDFAGLHSEGSIVDARSVTELARTLTDGPLTHAGVCSGAWAAARVALDQNREDRVILVNLLTWRTTAPLISAATLSDFTTTTTTTTEATTSLRSKIKPLVARYAPALLSDAVARAGVMQSPYLLLAPLSRARIETHLIFGTNDYDHFVSQRGLEALGRVSRRGFTPKVHVAAGGDHAGFHPVVRRTALAVCLYAVDVDKASQQ